MQWLKQSTAVTVKIGPFADSTDGDTDETGLTIAQADVRLSKNGGDIAQKNEAASCAHDELGIYGCPLDTTDTNTLGRLQLWVHEAGALHVWHEFMVVPANVWDSMFGSDKLQVDTTQVEGSDATDQINAACDTALTDYNGPTNAEMEARTLVAASYFDPTADAVADVTTVATLTGHTAQTGDNYARLGAPAAASIAADLVVIDNLVDDLETRLTAARAGYLDELAAANIPADVDTLLTRITAAVALASVCTETRLAELAAANLPADIDTLISRITAAVALASVCTETRLAELDAANLPADVDALPTTAEVNAEIDTALADIHLDHLLAVDYDPASKPGTATALLNELVESDAGVSRFTENALEQAPSGTGASAAAIADAVWDEAAADHVAAGSFGTQAGTDIDAILADTNELQTDLVDGGRLDLLVDTIKAKTDNLPADPADDSDIDAQLATIAGYLDTEVAAILADTGELQTDWANGGRLDLLIDAIKAVTDNLPNSGALNDLATILTDTNELQTDDVPGLIAALNDLTAAAIRTEIDTNSTQLAAIVADTNELQTDDVPGLIGVLNDLSAAQVNAEADTALADYDPPTKAELDTGLGALNDVAVTDITQRQIPDSIPADGTRPTIEQALYMIVQRLYEAMISGTTMTVRKVDGSTPLLTLTLDDDTDPTSVTRAT